MSLPGLTFTRNKANTGRWSEVLITGQDEYLTAWMSSLYRLRYTTRSWEAERGETDGNSLCTSTLERSTGSRETDPFIYHAPLREIKCLGQGYIHKECVSDPSSSSVPSSEHRGECTGRGWKAGKMSLAACAKLSPCSRIQQSFFANQSHMPCSPQATNLSTTVSHADRLWKAAFSHRRESPLETDVRLSSPSQHAALKPALTV